MNIDRVNAEMAKQIALIISRDLKDPRITGMISVTKVSVTQDLKFAKVYISVLNGDAQTTFSIISGAAGHIRNELKSKVKIRTLPELKFFLDDSIEYGMKIENILKDIKGGE